jgi:hypothetical protein
MNVRIAGVVAVVTASLLSGGVAHAAKKKPAPPPVCNQLTDDANDATFGGSLNPAGQPSSATLDILSADIASGKKNVVAAIRLRSLEKDTWTTGGSSYTLSWVSDGVKRAFTYRTYADSTPADATFDADTAGGTLSDLIPVVATVTPATATITFTMARKLEPSLKKAGVSFTELGVNAYLAVNRQGGYTSSGMDVASSPRKYTDGALTCLKGV